MLVGFEHHHQETPVPHYGNGSISRSSDARGDGESSLGRSSSGNSSSGFMTTSPTFPHLRHHHHSRSSHGSSSPSFSSPSNASTFTVRSTPAREFQERSVLLSETGTGAGGPGSGENETTFFRNSRLSPSPSSSQSSGSSSSWSSAVTGGGSPSVSGNIITTHRHHQHHLSDTLADQSFPSTTSFRSAMKFTSNHTNNNANSSHKTFSLEQIVNKSVVNVGRYHPNSSSSPFSIQFDEMESLDNSEDNVSTSYFGNGTSSDGGSVVLAGINSTSDSEEFRKKLYATIVPVMIFFCVLAVLVNLIIVISARWCRKPMSPTLYFSISLALADAYAALILATGLVINSLLPYVFDYKDMPICFTMVVEAFRQGGVLVTVCHLLALAMNHWIGIVRPLHYAATMTRRTAWIVIILSWICPITMIFIYFTSVYGEGFQSRGCGNYQFLLKRTYRAFFASCFFAPLILMSFIYIHIFIIVRNHHTHRQRYQSTQQLKRNVKAVLTTMLVLGTYIIGWMPATLFSLISCTDCVYQPSQISDAVKYSIGFVTNLLVILKTLVDPVIYAARMSDIQMALKKMRYDILATFCKSCAPAVPPNDRGSFYETKSMRMSSFGSRSSSRRMPANAGNASLIHHPNGNQIHLNSQQQQPHKPLSQHAHQHPHAGAGTNGYIPCATESVVGSMRPLPNAAANGGSRRSLIQNSQPQPLIYSKSAFEMTEMN